MKTRIALIGVILLGYGVCAEATTISDNAANAFSITNGNPNGDWSYGQYTTLETPSSFSVYNTDVTDPPTGIQVWRNGSNSDPNVTYNPTSSAINAYNISWEPGALALGGSSVGGTVVRWTASQAGTADIHAFFQTIQAPNNSRPTVYVYLDGTQLYNSLAGLYNGWSVTYDSSSSLTVAVGDTIDFVSHGDWTQRLDATVTETVAPEPSALVLLASGLIGLLCYAWRKRR